MCVRTLRFPGESNVAYRARAERTGRIARIFVDASLANRCMQDYIADPAPPYTVESVQRSPTASDPAETAERLLLGNWQNRIRI